LVAHDTIPLRPFGDKVARSDHISRIAPGVVSRVISLSIARHADFHREKIGTTRCGVFDYGEKATEHEKLLQCMAVLCRNVMCFAKNLGSSARSWHDYVHSGAKMPSTLFYPNLLARPPPSIFVPPS
jgi:hypothetical protein